MSKRRKQKDKKKKKNPIDVPPEEAYRNLAGLGHQYIENLRTHVKEQMQDSTFELGDVTSVVPLFNFVCHRCRKDGHNFRPGHLFQVRTNNKGGLDSDKNVARSTKRLGPADAHQLGEDIGETPDDEGHNSQIIQGTDKSCKEDNGGSGNGT